jgi:hypothetical protein
MEPNYVSANVSEKAANTISMQIVYYSIFIFLLLFFSNTYHQNGMKLLITTRYKRQDIVLARYFLVLVIFLCILFSTFLYLISFCKISYLEILPILLLSYIMYTPTMSILIPISFWFKNFYIGCAVGYLPVFSIIALSTTGNNNSNFSTYNRFGEKLFYSLNKLPIATQTFSFTTLFLLLSIYLSLQIFKHKEM